MALVLLEGLEEVLNLKGAIFGHVGAVHCVSNSIVAKLSPECVGAQVLGNLGVVGTAQFTQSVSDIFLSHLERDHGTRAHVFDQGKVLGKHTLVNVEELLHDGAGQVEHFHCADLETSFQN